MPKRIPTPEPGDDEPKYFTVVQPYPLNANWELPHDYITFGRWIAGCIGPEPFFALFYKPSARGQVLLEINRDYPHPERLLGEHRWSEFLRKPSVEEAGRVSQIFYCIYSTGRQAQKDGWKRINVSDSWFKNWTPENPVIMSPYPPTTWCPLPAEDRTNKPMCRPLPVSVKPPPPPKAAPAPVVPGSAKWVNQKGAPPTNTPAQLRGAWATQTQRGGAANAPSAKNAAKRAIPATSSAPWHTATAPKSNNTVPASKNPPAFPPGLAPLPGEADFPAPPGITRGPSSASSASSTEAFLPVSTLTAGFVGISISPSMEANLYGGAVDVSPDPNAYVAEWEKMPVVEPEALWPTAGDGGYKVQKTEVVENLWGDEDDVVKKQTEILCTVHGIICKKGICKERSARNGRRRRARLGAVEKKKGANPWNDDDSGSATGSEGRARSPATAPKNDGWSTVRGR
ncbi:hypothetical protein B0H13DRAFT_2172855 [Mycena leptocephala]|nr:hypothetical protein B0H13DRAFT_2172855 [Mycena leptocephala]